MPEQTNAYKAGFDCGTNGPNEQNCHFTIFATRENTKEWERGKKDGEVAAERILKRGIPVRKRSHAAKS